jgi:hypothetical protein
VRRSKDQFAKQFNYGFAMLAAEPIKTPATIWAKDCEYGKAKAYTNYKISIIVSPGE